MRTIKNSDFLCFQVLLSFVPTIFHFLKFPAFFHSSRDLVFLCRPLVQRLACDNVSLD
jgi:hypothetical protein